MTRKLKSRLVDADHSRDPVHFTIPESLRQTEDEISLVCNRKQMSIFDMNPPLQTLADQILVRRTIDRRTGMVIAEENVHDLHLKTKQDDFLGKSQKRY